MSALRPNILNPNIQNTANTAEIATLSSCDVIMPRVTLRTERSQGGASVEFSEYGSDYGSQIWVIKLLFVANKAV